jgi:predicted nucleic acid-binding protein
MTPCALAHSKSIPLGKRSVATHAKATTQLRLFDKLLKDCRLGNATNAVFEAAVNIHVALKSKGRICDDMNILIAAFCQTYGLTLVTNNTRHFENIPGLALADWSAAVEG